MTLGFHHYGWWKQVNNLLSICKWVKLIASFIFWGNKLFHVYNSTVCLFFQWLEKPFRKFKNKKFGFLKVCFLFGLHIKILYSGMPQNISNFLINQLVIIATVLNYHFKNLNCTIIIAGFLKSRNAVLVRNCFFSNILFSYHGFAFLEFKNCHFFLIKYLFSGNINLYY